MSHWRAWSGLAFLVLAAGLVVLVQWVERPLVTTPEGVADQTSVQIKAETKAQPQPQELSADTVTPTPSLPAQPSYVLTDEEVQALSVAEQEQYLRMLESLQTIQQQVEVLEQEQTQLEQRVSQRTRENALLHDELDAIRQATEQPAVTGGDAEGVPGETH